MVNLLNKIMRIASDYFLKLLTEYKVSVDFIRMFYCKFINLLEVKRAWFIWNMKNCGRVKNRKFLEKTVFIV